MTGSQVVTLYPTPGTRAEDLQVLQRSFRLRCSFQMINAVHTCICVLLLPFCSENGCVAPEHGFVELQTQEPIHAHEHGVRSILTIHAFGAWTWRSLPPQFL
jgi:hypothetical protein